MTSVGLALPQMGSFADRTLVRTFCEEAELQGYASLWTQEHLFFPHAVMSDYAGHTGRAVPAQYRSMLSPTETMMAALAWTERVQVGSSILVAGYHRPVDLAKRIATLDVLSGGRVMLGLSVGWSDEEHRQMDVDPRTRGRRCDELVDALKACWDEDPVSYEGDFFSIPLSDVSPKPIQRPRPPLLSGMLSPAGRRRTADKFDIWNPVGDPFQVREQLEEMNGWRPEGRPPLEVYLRLFLERPGGEDAPPGIEGTLANVARARDAGMDSVIIEANFWSGIDSADAWLELPGALADTLEAP